MSLAALIGAHGYWVLVLGCLLEGDTVLLLAGLAVHRGYLDPFAVVATAALAGFAGDQFFFWLGRRHGPAVLARWPSLNRQAARLDRLRARYDAALIVGVRFAYGLRIAGPMFLGMSAVAPLRFVWLNALGALLWAMVVGGAGWIFGEAAQMMLGRIRHLEAPLFLVLAAIGGAFWLIRRRGRPPRS